jgi:hypothetical protein
VLFGLIMVLDSELAAVPPRGTPEKEQG